MSGLKWVLGSVIIVAVALGHYWQWRQIALSHVSDQEIVAAAAWNAVHAFRLFEPGKDLKHFKGPIALPSLNPKIQRHFIWLDPNDERRTVVGVWIKSDGGAEAYGGVKQ